MSRITNDFSVYLNDSIELPSHVSEQIFPQLRTDNNGRTIFSGGTIRSAKLYYNAIFGNIQCKIFKEFRLQQFVVCLINQAPKLYWENMGLFANTRPYAFRPQVIYSGVRFSWGAAQKKALPKNKGEARSGRQFALYPPLPPSQFPCSRCFPRCDPTDWTPGRGYL